MMKKKLALKRERELKSKNRNEFTKSIQKTRYTKGVLTQKDVVSIFNNARALSRGSKTSPTDGKKSSKVLPRPQSDRKQLSERSDTSAKGKKLHRQYTAKNISKGRCMSIFRKPKNMF